MLLAITVSPIDLDDSLCDVGVDGVGEDCLDPRHPLSECDRDSLFHLTDFLTDISADRFFGLPIFQGRICLFLRWDIHHHAIAPARLVLRVFMDDRESASLTEVLSVSPDLGSGQCVDVAGMLQLSNLSSCSCLDSISAFSARIRALRRSFPSAT